MSILSYTPSIPSLLESKAYMCLLNSTSNGTFKNRINPVSKVNLKKTTDAVFWTKQNTLLKSPSHYIKSEKHIRDTGPPGVKRKAPQQLRLQLGHTANIHERRFPSQWRVYKSFIPQEELLYDSHSLSSSSPFMWCNPWQSHKIINLRAERDQK